jgi:hypothetical protein
MHRAYTLLIERELYQTAHREADSIIAVACCYSDLSASLLVGFGASLAFQS